MAKKRTKRIALIKETLIDKIQNEHGRVGNFFLSNRELSMRYGVSYLTAHRLITELCDENYLHRAPRSGTYIANESVLPSRMVLVFNPAGKVRNGFGDQLSRLMQKRCEGEGIECEVQWSNAFDHYPEGGFPIVWGVDYNLREFVSKLHYGILLNERANAGVNSTFTDSILIDNYSGGLVAAQLAKLLPKKSKVLVLAGPENGLTVQERLNGVKALIPSPRIIHFDAWQMDNARRGLAGVELEDADVVICLHDTASDAFHERFGNALPVIRFGDLELAKAHSDTCVVIPWDDIVEACIDIYKMRADGESKVGKQHIFATKLSIQEPWKKLLDADALKMLESVQLI